MQSPTKRAFTRAALGVALAGLASASLAFFPFGRHDGPPAGLDYGVQRMSEKAVYRASYKSDTLPVPISRLHTWVLHVETADGRPVADAAVKVDGDMPEHGHGLPTRPRVTRNLGNGDYLVEGVKFQMGGWWVMDFTIDAAGQSDVARFNLMLRK